MATGRTVSASFLTQKDEQIILLCGEMSATILEEISGEDSKKSFELSGTAPLRKYTLS